MHARLCSPQHAAGPKWRRHFVMHKHTTWRRLLRTQPHSWPAATSPNRDQYYAWIVPFSEPVTPRLSAGSGYLLGIIQSGKSDTWWRAIHAVFCSKESTVASMLPINNVFNSHTLNPSGCGPVKTKSTLGEKKKWALSGNNWNLQNLYELNKDDETPFWTTSLILNYCSFPCACQVAHYPLQESTDPPN